MSLTIHGLENSLQKLTTFPISCRHNFATIGPLILMKMGVTSERPQDLNVVPLSWKQGFPWLFVYRNCTAGSLDVEVYHTLALLEKRWSNMESLYFELLPKTKSSDFFKVDHEAKLVSNPYSTGTIVDMNRKEQGIEQSPAPFFSPP